MGILELTLSGQICIIMVFIVKICAEIAQSVERRTENPCVHGSIPCLGTTLR